MYEVWTPEAEAELTSRIWKDQSYSRIAERTGRSESAVRQKAIELGLRKAKFWTDQRVEACKVLYDEGLSTSKIGKELGVTRNAIIGLSHRKGWTRATEIKGTPEERAARRKVRRRQIYSEQAGFKPREEYEAKTEWVELFTPATKVSFADLDEWHHCRFPIGHPGTPDFGYCGAQKVDGHSYCPGHCRIAYQPSRHIHRSVWRD